MHVTTALAASFAAATLGSALCYLASPHQQARAVPWRAPAWLRPAGLALVVLALAPLIATMSAAVAVFAWLVWLMFALTLAPFAGVALARRRAARGTA